MSINELSSRLLPATMVVATDGTAKTISIDAMTKHQVAVALQLGIAEMVHAGQLRIDDIRID